MSKGTTRSRSTSRSTSSSVSRAASGRRRSRIRGLGRDQGRGRGRGRDQGRGRGGLALIRLRLGHGEAHYAGNLVDGARVLQLFGDVATELCIRSDGEEGLLRAYASVEFLAPVRGGDYLEVRGRIVRVGSSSRDMEFTAHKVIEADASGSGRARPLSPRVLVGRARGTCVVRG